MSNNKKTSLTKSADFYIAIFMYLFCGIVLYQIINIRIADSKIMPIIVLAISFASATLLLVKDILGKGSDKEVGVLKFTRIECIGIVLLFVSYYLIRILGFYTSSLLLTIGISIFLWKPSTLKRGISLLIYNLVLIGIVYLLFNNFFGINVPSGIFI